MNIPSPTQQLSDEVLLRKYQETQDSNTLGVLYEKYFSDIYRLCWYWVKDREHAFDLTHTVFLKSIDKLDQLKRLENYRFWLHSIAYNSTMSFINWQNRELMNQEQFEKVYPYLIDDDAALREKMLSSLEHAMQELPKPTNELLRLKYQENKSIHELQDFYGLSESAVKMRLARARNKLKRLMADAA